MSRGWLSYFSVVFKGYLRDAGCCCVGPALSTFAPATDAPEGCLRHKADHLTLPGAARPAPHQSPAGSPLHAGSPLECWLPPWSRCLSKFVPSAASPQNGAEMRARETRETRARDEKDKRRARTRETRPTPFRGRRVPGRVRACEKNKQRQDEFGETVGPQPPTSLTRLTLPGAAWSAPHQSPAGSPLECWLLPWSRCLSRFVPSAASPQNGAETRTRITRITRINSSRYEKERCCRELVYLVSTL